MAGLGGVGAAGVWRLAVIAVIVAALVPMVDICLHGPSDAGAPAADLRAVRVTCGCPLTVAVVLLGGVRAGFLVVLVLGAAALGAMMIDGPPAGLAPG